MLTADGVELRCAERKSRVPRSTADQPRDVPAPEIAVADFGQEHPLASGLLGESSDHLPSLSAKSSWTRGSLQSLEPAQGPARTVGVDLFCASSEYLDVMEGLGALSRRGEA